ncbi:MAG: T9SS type A sorting domain-containing protein [Bacteroidetes bacterium]|nr:T9SS type A sorting domain-containing protein [Bacteroidota bacterium]
MMKNLTKLMMSLIVTLFAINVNAQNCGIPTGLSATSINGATTLAWNAVPGASSYTVEIQNAQGNPQVITITLQSITNSIMPQGLNNGANYKFKVRTNCGGQNSNWSNVFFFVAGGGGGNACNTAPANLTVSNITAKGAKFTWGPVLGATSYRVRVENGQNNPVPFLLIRNTVNTTITIGNVLTASTSYKVKARALCGANNTSPWTPWIPFTTAVQRLSSDNSLFEGLAVYPNPANEKIQFELSDGFDGQQVNFSIVDLQGKVIVSQNFEANENANTLDLTEVKNGVYMVKLTIGETQTMQRLVVAH